MKTFRHQRLVSLLMVVLISLSTLFWSNSIYIHLKAHLAQKLISSSWSKTLLNNEAGGISKPWGWADTWPIAKLETKSQVLFILAGAHGSALAFGPGHVNGTAEPGSFGTSVVAGHRDTHFKFLAQAKIGDQYRIQNRRGHWSAYDVTEILIKDTRVRDTWMIDSHKNELQLVTCYPFDAPNAGGPLRLLVILTMRSKTNNMT